VALVLIVGFSGCVVGQPILDTSGNFMEATTPDVEVINEGDRTLGDTLGGTPVHGYEIVKKFPHRNVWTEGLSFVNGKLYESTGPSAKQGSIGGELSEVDLNTGKALSSVKYKDIYGEGAAHLGNQFYVLSYREHKIEEFDDKLTKETGAIPAPTGADAGTGQGWGATTDGASMVYSDGSNKIRWLDPTTKKVTKEITVEDQSGAGVQNLNELEWVKDEIWANVWQTYRIARINPTTGKVNSFVDLSGIHAKSRDIGANGIAYDKAKDMLVVTGKEWNEMYQIKVKP